MDTKRCSKCKEIKPVSEFNRWRTYGDGYYPSCKICKEKVKAVYRRNNPDKMKAIRQRHYQKNRINIIRRTSEYIKQHPEIKLKIALNAKCKQYGMSLEEYNDIKNDQGGLCRICNKKPDHTLFIDHCHKTLKVRGLLCRECNAILGFCNDSIEVLQSAINYLSRSE